MSLASRWATTASLRCWRYPAPLYTRSSPLALVRPRIGSASVAVRCSTSISRPSDPKTQNGGILSKLKPYAALARLDKPTGTLLLFWPCAWSLAMAAQALHTPPTTLAWQTVLFGTGAFIMRGAGCTINDMWDRKLDANVERTKSRPLAAGDITPFQALVFLGGQLSAGLAVLLQLNTYSILLGASSLSLVVIYPLMKRITYWPQFVLGLAFNWGALLGWSALAASLDAGALSVVLPLYAGSILWTLVYDTIYAHQDRVDDVGAGIKSTALLFGEQTKPILAAFAAGHLSLFALAASKINPSSFSSSSSLIGTLMTHHPCLSVSLAAAASHYAWQLWTVDLNSREDCWAKFRSNVVLGFLLWAGLVADYYLVMASEAEPQALVTSADADAHQV